MSLEDLTEDQGVICPCCGKRVSSIRIELAFKRPDCIAQLPPDDIPARCKFNNDLYVLDAARYFIRCTLPLPLHGLIEPYSLGVWVEVEHAGFMRVWDLWDEDDQSQEPPIPAQLANDIPLTHGTLGARVAIQLTGASTRPTVSVLDAECSLYQEQQQGISLHRASEFSDLIR